MFKTDTVLTSFIISLLVSIFTAVVSYRYFRKGHIWQLKVEKYDAIFSAMFDISKFFRARLTGIKNSEEIDDSLTEDYDEAVDYLEEVVFIGEFIIREKAVNLLKQLIDSLKQKEPGFLRDTFTSDNKENYCKDKLSKIRSAYREIGKIAKSDLKVTK